MRAIVTGANGFIGSHLVRALLDRGDTPAAMVRRTSNVQWLAGMDVPTVFADVRAPETLPESVRNCDVVYHLAGNAWGPNRDDFFSVNRDGTRNLLEACSRRTSPPAVVLVSSLAAAGPSPQGKPICEDCPPHPVSHYGESKLAAEQVAREYADRVPISIVRPCVVIGERDRQALELFRTPRRLRCHVTPGAGDGCLSVIHVAELTPTLIEAATRGERLLLDGNKDCASARGIYFAASGESPSLASLGKWIGEAVGRPRAVKIAVPRPLVWAMAGAAEVVNRAAGLSFPFGLDKAREALAGSWVCSIERIQAEFGFSPRATLRQRIQQTADWYLEQGWI